MIKQNLLLPLLFIGFSLLSIQNGFAQSKPLQPKNQAPTFTAKAALDGEAFTFSLQEALAEGPVVLYFFPSAYTKGCDIEARTFSENIEKFEEANTTVIGVSADSIERLKRFSADPQYCAGEFPMASDPKGKIAAMYELDIMHPQRKITDINGNVIKHGFIPRTTFVIKPNGTIAAVFSSKFDNITPVQHVMKALEVVQKM